jgi:hypothetical protein
MVATVLDTALSYLQAGYSIVPIAGDGTKRCKVTWSIYNERKPTEEEVRQWFGKDDGKTGIAIICGQISKGLEVVDFDAPGFFEEWTQIVDVLDSNLLGKLPVIKTPKGFGRHVYFRTGHPTAGGPLARTPHDRGSFSVAIEKRGERQYVIAPGSPACCHKLNENYEQVFGPPIEETPLISSEEREALLSAASGLNRYHETTKTGKGRPGAAEGRPGDIYVKADEWEPLLEKHGWVCVRTKPDKGESMWRRPLKVDPGISATLGHCNLPQDGGRLLYCFSTNAPPFESDQCYNLFAAFTLLEHNGDWAKASQDLAEKGFGELIKVPPEILNGIYEGFDAAKADEGVLPEQIQKIVNAAIYNNRNFKQTWELKIAEFSQKQYLCALFHYLAKILPDVVDQTRVIYSFITRHDKYFEDSKNACPEQLAKIYHYITRAKDRYRTSNSPHVGTVIRQAEVEEIAVESSGDEDKRLKGIRDLLGMQDFERLIQRGRSEGVFFCQIKAYPEIRIGLIQDVRDAVTFANRVLEVTGSLIPRMKAFEWDVIVQMMIEHRDLQIFTGEEDNDQTELMLENYLEHAGVREEEHWNDAAFERIPFARQGRLYLNIENFLRFANYRRRRELTPKELRAKLKQVGFESEQMSVRIGKQVFGRSLFSRKQEKVQGYRDQIFDLSSQTLDEIIKTQVDQIDQSITPPENGTEDKIENTGI